MISGKTLIAWGYAPGPWFAAAIPAAEKASASGADEAAIRAIVDGFAPAPAPKPVPLRAAGGVPFTLNIRAEEPEDADNIAGVERHMVELMRVPTLVAGAVMPDACPSGSAPGTIPVGGVVAAKDAIHPGFHSADICCSMAFSLLGDVEPTAVLDAGMRLSHFGGGGRPHSHDMQPPDALMADFADNKLLAITTDAATKHFGTQGDGNHFFCGIPDVSELPGAYKSAAVVRRQIAEYGLAEVVDTVEPIGSIMAGDWQRDAPWRRKKQAARASREVSG